MRANRRKNPHRFDLSPLEQDVLNALWPDRRMLVREIHAALRTKRRVSHSSVAVILDRLHSRGIVSRNSQTCRGGTRYIYVPKTKKDQLVTRVIDSAINSLIDRFGATAVNYFEERFSGKRRS